MGCNSSVIKSEKKNTKTETTQDCCICRPEHLKMEQTCQQPTDPRTNRLVGSGCRSTVENNQHVCLQEMRTITEDAVAKLQERVFKKKNKDWTQEDLYINQICRTMEHTLILLKNKKPVSRTVCTEKVVKTENKEAKAPELIDSSSSEFQTLNYKLCNALLLRLILKYSKKKNSMYLRHTGTIWRRLTHLVMAKVEIGDRDFMIIEDNINDIAKAMIRDLLRIFVTPENLLRAAMIPDDPIFDQAVINFLQREVEARKKKGRLGRFFEKIGKALCCC